MGSKFNRSWAGLCDAVETGKNISQLITLDSSNKKHTPNSAGKGDFDQFNNREKYSAKGLNCGICEHSRSQSKNKFHRDLSSFPIGENFSDANAITNDTRESVALTLSATSISNESSLAETLNIKDRAYKFFECICNFVNQTSSIPDSFYDELIGANDKILPGHSPGSLLGEIRDFTKYENKRDCCLEQLRYILSLIPNSFNGACPAAEEIRASQVLQRFAWFSEVIKPSRAELYVKQLADDMGDIKNNVWGNGIFQMRTELRNEMLRHEFNLDTLSQALVEQVKIFLQNKTSVPELDLAWILLAFSSKMKAVSISTTAGYRGRYGGGLAKTQLKDASNIIRTQFLDRAIDRGGTRTDICQPRCSDISQNISETTIATIGQKTPVKALLEALKNEKVCENDEVVDVFPSHGELPATVINLINNPILFLQDAIKECPGFPPEIAQEFNESMKRNRAKLEKIMQNCLLNTHFLDNRNEELSIWKMVQLDGTETKYEARPTSGDIIRSTGLRTVSSTSGTTCDILAAYHSLFGPEKMNEIFSPLVDFVNNGCNPEEIFLNDDFKKIFLQTALQFKAGNFHSTGEILAALYFSTLKMFPNLEPKRNEFTSDQDYPAAVYENLKKLLIVFLDHPEDFFPMSNDYKKLFRENIEQIISTAQAEHMKNIKERINPATVYHEAPF
ncbi:MAG: hypothetical protein LBI61_01275 [Puniceicoccales bacterium]|jgi:hypothetical protein|nr:hypothetical protein [Puniceicoccales bacterium]